MLGRTFSHYLVLEQIGAGGMGVVYRARDTRLERDVALKVLHAGALGDEPSRRRFRDEALALAKLNHPNIGVIHDFDTQEGVDFLVMEYILGQTLTQKLASGPLQNKDVLAFSGQIAAALEEAHEHGLVHRDLKPGNVMVTPKGQAKVLDFGLAKLLHLEDSMVTVKTLHETQAFAGTIPYMAPEQLRGEPADTRTDLYALGAVIFEMTTGRRAFPGNAGPAVAGDILHKPVTPPSTLRASIPAELERIILKCLEKEPENRYQSAKEIGVDLRRLASPALTTPPSLTQVPQQPGVLRNRRRLAIYAGGACVLLLVAVGIWRVRLDERLDLPAGALQIQQITGFPDSAVQPALSPDGKMLAFIRGPSTFVTPGQVYLKLLPNGEPLALTHDEMPKMSPVFSPDGTRIAYTVLTADQSWDTWAVPALGGEVRPLLSNASGLNWTGPEQLLFSEIKSGIHMALVAANASRTQTRDVYVPEDSRGMVHRSYLSPDGKWVLVVQMDRGGMGPCRLISFGGNLPPKAAGPQIGQCTFASWSRDGRWMYFSSNASGSFQLWRQRFPDGMPEQLTLGPTTAEGIAMSPDGRSLVTSMGLLQRSVWLHENGTDRQISGEGDAVLPAWGDGFPTSVFSPDGKKLYYLVPAGAVRGFGGGGGELWVRDLASDTNEAVLPGLVVTSYDISADGQRVLFAALGQDGKSHLWLAGIDRRFAARQLLPDEAFGPVFGGDDNAYFREWEGQLSYIYEIQLASGQVQKAISEPAISSPIVSPDGRWIVSSTPSAGQKSSTIVKAYPHGGGASVTICQACFVKWSRDRRSFLLSFSAGNLMGGGPTYVVKLPPGKDLPILPKGGFNSAADLQKLVKTEVIDQPEIFPGVTSSSYAFVKQVVQRNLYRVSFPNPPPL